MASLYRGARIFDGGIGCVMATRSWWMAGESPALRQSRSLPASRARSRNAPASLFCLA